MFVERPGSIFSSYPILIKYLKRYGISFFWQLFKTYFPWEYIRTHTLSRKLSEISQKFPKKFRALLPLAHFKKGNFSRFEETQGWWDFLTNYHLWFLPWAWVLNKFVMTLMINFKLKCHKESLQYISSV